MSYYLFQACIAIGGTVGFCIIFRVPIRVIPICACIGGLSWVSYKMICGADSDNIIIASFLAAALVGLLSEICARIFKEPTTLFIVPGVLTLVPGFHIFKAMETLISNDPGDTGTWLTDVVKIAAAIALGLLAIGAVFHVLQAIIHKTVVVTHKTVDAASDVMEDVIDVLKHNTRK